MPPAVVGAVSERWPERGATWAAQVEGELSALCARLQAEPVRVLPARFGLVVEARADGHDLVLRSSPDPAAGDQAAVARALAGLHVAPAVHEIVSTPCATWTVMDRVLPGTSLFDADPAAVNPADILDQLRRMVDQPVPPALGTVADWLRDRLESPDLSDMPPGSSPAPENERAAAIATLEQLLTDSAGPSLCHGDLSPGNVLLGHNRVWLIDPRGLAGEIAYDVAVLALKAARNDPTAARSLA